MIRRGAASSPSTARARGTSRLPGAREWRAGWGGARLRADARACCRWCIHNSPGLVQGMGGAWRCADGPLCQEATLPLPTPLPRPLGPTLAHPPLPPPRRLVFADDEAYRAASDAIGHPVGPIIAQLAIFVQEATCALAGTAVAAARCAGAGTRVGWAGAAGALRGTRRLAAAASHPPALAPLPGAHLVQSSPTPDAAARPAPHPTLAPVHAGSLRPSPTRRLLPRLKSRPGG